MYVYETGQVVHVELPGESENVPTGHGRQGDGPGTKENLRIDDIT